MTMQTVRTIFLSEIQGRILAGRQDPKVKVEEFSPVVFREKVEVLVLEEIALSARTGTIQGEPSEVLQEGIHLRTLAATAHSKSIRREVGNDVDKALLNAPPIVSDKVCDKVRDKVWGVLTICHPHLR